MCFDEAFVTLRTFSIDRKENCKTLPSKKRNAGDEHIGWLVRDSKHENLMKTIMFLVP